MPRAPAPDPLPIYLPEPARRAGEFEQVLATGLADSQQLRRVASMDEARGVLLDVHRLEAAAVERLADDASRRGLAVVAADYGDGHRLRGALPGVGRLFKRSMVRRQAGRSLERLRYPRPVEHLAYCVRKDQLDWPWTPASRDVDVACLLCPLGKPGARRRAEVARTLRDRLRGPWRVHVGPLGEGGARGRNRVQREYLAMLRRARVVVTCQPDRWEGDWRLFEALAAGALVIQDRMLLPPAGLVPGEHFLCFDRLGQLPALVTRYLVDDAARLAIAERGQRAALTRHLPEHRVEQMFAGLD